MSIWKLVLRSVLVAVPLVGCSDGGGSGTGVESVVGTYNLTQVNGVAVPGQPFGSGAMRFIAGSLTLNPDGTHRQNLTVQPTPNHEVRTYSYTGAYTVSSTAVDMSVAEGDEAYPVRQVRREGSVLVGEAGRASGVIFTYRK